MRRIMTIMAALGVALLITTAATAQVRGRGRLQGVVTDKDSGKPVAGATVTVALANGSTQPIVGTTDSHGHWSALGLVGGLWNIDIVAPGYETSRGTANVSEMQQLPMIQTKMSPEQKQEAAAPTVAATPLVPKEAADAIEEGQELMKQQKYKEAVADFEKALPMVPADKAETKTVHTQLMQVMSQAYYRAGDLKNAIAMLQQVIAADPTSVPTQVLLANVYLENGQLDEGRQVLEKLPEGAITDPVAYVNVGILFLNRKNAKDASVYFSKAIAIDPKSSDGYYYRGLAESQLGKNAEARNDFTQVITLASDPTQVKDAKAMLEALPKK